MKLMRYWNPICLLIVAIMTAVTLLGYPLVVANSADRSTLGMICISILFAGEGICTIIFASVYLDRRVSAATFFFMCLLSMEFFYLSLEIVGWEAKEIFNSGYVLNAVHHAEHLVPPAMLFLFICYQVYILKFPKEKLHRLLVILTWLALAEAVMVVINLPTNLMFGMDGLEISVGPLRALLFIPPCLMAAVSVWLTVNYSPDIRHKITLLSCLALPIAIGLLSYPLHIPSFTAISILAVYLLLYGEIYVDRGMRIAKYEAEIMEQKVAMMVSRIEPEFLEESLESIMMMEGNPPETVEAISEFKKYLNENVGTISLKAPIPFDTELAHVESYVKLEKLRFKDKLNVMFDIGVRDFMLPAMTLQMIVENAIKHGITQKESGGTVTITTAETEDSYVIIVEDTGVGFDVNAPRPENGSHIGLTNLSSRLTSMVGGTFEISSEIGVGTTARVVIPKK